MAVELDLDADDLSCLGARGSTENSSSTATKSDVEVRLKGAVGLTTPCLTGASRELAVSHSSSTAMLIRACNGTSEYHPDITQGTEKKLNVFQTRPELAASRLVKVPAKQ